MPSSFTFILQLCACAATFLAGSIAAQEPAADVIASWIALDAPTGHEHLAIESIQRNFSGWEKDRYGNLAKVVGNGTNRRVVACALDTYSYAVSQITEKGYLRLHRIGSGSRHPLWDQAHEVQHLLRKSKKLCLSKHPK